MENVETCHRQERTSLNNIEQEEAERGWKRLKAFFAMRSELEEFLNPFSKPEKQPLPLIVYYIFWCIGELSHHDRQMLEAITPQLRTKYYDEETWQAIVAKVMCLSTRWNTRLKRTWERNVRAAQESSVPLTPLQFARNVIERNFLQ